jgi:hypothetical protein
VHTITGGWGEQHFPLAVGHGTNPDNDIDQFVLAQLLT